MTPAQAAEETAIMIAHGYRPVPPDQMLEMFGEHYVLRDGKPDRLRACGRPARDYGYPIFVRDESKQPSTTLPTEPGLYWWRTEGATWALVEVWHYGGYPRYSLLDGGKYRYTESSIIWKIDMGIGQWLPCLPPEREVQG